MIVFSIFLVLNYDLFLLSRELRINNLFNLVYQIAKKFVKKFEKKVEYNFNKIKKIINP